MTKDQEKNIRKWQKEQEKREAKKREKGILQSKRLRENPFKILKKG